MKTILSLILLFCLSSFCYADREVWILVQDNCPPCTRLKADVFNYPLNVELAKYDNDNPFREPDMDWWRSTKLEPLTPTVLIVDGPLANGRYKIVDKKAGYNSKEDMKKFLAKNALGKSVLIKKEKEEE